MTRILVVDDDPVALRLTAEAVERAGFSALTAMNGEDALRHLRADPAIAAVVLDLVMPDLDGMAVMEVMAREHLGVPVIAVTASPEPEIIASALRQGAADFVVKPISPERLVVSLRNVIQLSALQTLLRTDRTRRDTGAGRGDLIAEAPAMERVTALIARAAKTPMPVLIEGEAGTGKDLIARIIHNLGDRSARPLVTINCTDEPLDAAPATGGTLLLRDVDALDATGQDALLRLLQTGANVRVIATTSRRLLNLAKSGELREDLYYRLNVFPIYVPPLRDRREDIAALVRHFTARSAAESGRRVAGISAEALALLELYAWPGNIRQLQRTIHRAVVLAEASTLVPADFPQILAASSGRDEALKLTANLPLPSAPVHIDAATSRLRATAHKDSTPDRFLTAKGDLAALCDIERDLIAFAIRHHAGQMSRVARALKIGRSTLYRKLREYGLDDGIESDAA